MRRISLAIFGLVFGATLFGCASPPPPVSVALIPVAAPVPPPPPLPAIPGPVALVPAPPPQVPRLAAAPVRMALPSYPVAQAAHPVIHPPWVRRYAALRTDFGPPCGSAAHPCNVFHAVVPIQ